MRGGPEARRVLGLLLAARTVAALSTLLVLWRCYQAGCSLIPRPIEIVSALSGRLTVLIVASLGFIVGMLGLFLDEARIPGEGMLDAKVLTAGAVGLLLAMSLLALSVSVGSIILTRISLVLLAWALTLYSYGYYALRHAVAEMAGLGGPTWVLGVPFIGGPAGLALLALSRDTLSPGTLPPQQ